MKPILFSTPMVQAIQDGRKTMTRRVIKPQPCEEAKKFYRFIHFGDCGWVARFSGDVSSAVCDKKLKYDIGDILWVRETCWKGYDEKYHYKADYACGTAQLCKDIKIIPSIHMPREAARMFLRVTDVRVERLRDISVQDAKDEGIKVHANGCKDGMAFGCYNGDDCVYNRCKRPIEYFHELWDSINAKRGYGWDKNPWVWVYEFERVKQNEAV